MYTVFVCKRSIYGYISESPDHPLVVKSEAQTFDAVRASLLAVAFVKRGWQAEVYYIPN